MAGITYRTGDATVPEGAGPKVIVHVCNDRGGWGRGFVVALSRRYPEPERDYRAWYAGRAQNDFGLGAVRFVEVGPDLWVANLIGQAGYKTENGRPPVRYDAIARGLSAVAAFAQEHGAAVHMPRIGCGLAGGRWEEIEPILTERLTAAGVPVTVYDVPVAPKAT
jgi:O-acetyl-ADP-ribose deacetylase (regulator of RNase III)